METTEQLKEQIEALQQQIKEQEKLASLGLLTAGIVHEIRNPLNFVINFSKLSDTLIKTLLTISTTMPIKSRQTIWRTSRISWPT